MHAGEAFVQPVQQVARAPPSERPALLLHIRPLAGRAIRKEKTLEATGQSEHLSSRRSFLLKGAAAGAATIGAGRLLANPTPALASGGLTPGDAAILRLLAALETPQTDA